MLQLALFVELKNLVGWKVKFLAVIYLCNPQKQIQLYKSKLTVHGDIINQ